jgi:Zn-dependent protease
LPEITPEFIALGVTSYVVLLFSLSVHESAHAWMALRMGDDTAAQAGRITLNPVAHIDPLGTLVIPLVQMLWGGVPLLAWARPTPVQPANFKPGYFRKGHLAVSAAGPLSNLLLALLFTAGFFVFCRVVANPLAPGQPVLHLLTTGIFMNVGLCLFNLLPLPPLDGAWLASWGLPARLADSYDRLVEPWGATLLMLLVATGALGRLTGPPIGFLYTSLVRLAI